MKAMTDGLLVAGCVMIASIFGVVLLKKDQGASCQKWSVSALDSWDRGVDPDVVQQHCFSTLLESINHFMMQLRPIFENSALSADERTWLINEYMESREYFENNDKSPLSLLCISTNQLSWIQNGGTPCIVLFLGEDNDEWGCRRWFGNRIPYRVGPVWLLSSVEYDSFISSTDDFGLLNYSIRLDGPYWPFASWNRDLSSFQKMNYCRNQDDSSKCQQIIRTDRSCLSDNMVDAADLKNTAANKLFSLPEIPDGLVGDLARMFQSEDEDEVWRDYCLQFLGSALERTDGVTDADRALARETLVETLASTNATFAGTALRALHRGDPSDPLVASNALRIARDPAFPSASRTTALLVLEECIRTTSSTLQPFNPSTLADTAAAVSADSSASPLLRQAAEAVLKRVGSKTTND